MGELYVALPVDDEGREWLLSEGVQPPEEEGRLPTLRELGDALGCLENCELETVGGGRSFSVEISNVLTGAWTSVRVTEANGPDDPCEFYFSKGHPELVLTIVRKLAEVCGTYYVTTDTGASPVLINECTDVRATAANW